MAQRDLCPVCNASKMSTWAMVFAMWPFSTHCENCGAKLRLRLSFLQNLAIQLISLATFWGILFFGILCGLGVVFAFSLAVSTLILVVVITSRFARLEKV